MDQLPFEFKITIIGMDLDLFMDALEKAGFDTQLKEVEKQIEEQLQ